MKAELIHTLAGAFQAYAQPTAAAGEFDANHLPDVGKMVPFSLECFPVSLARADHFVDINKMANRACSAKHRLVGANKTILQHAGRRQKRSELRCLTRHQPLNSTAVDPIALTGYRSRHIRPMAVRPLDHPEREPTPWGFLFSGSGKMRSAPSQGRLP